MVCAGYVVSEFIEGPSLRDFVERHGPQSGAALERLALGTLTALAAVHQAGIVHRDFKPGNILLSPAGPRVMDFGIARFLDSTSSLTSQAIGTPAYMAPEQAIITAILDDEPDLGTLTGPLRPIVASCLAKDPAARPGAADLIARLLDASPPAEGPADATRMAATRVLTELYSTPTRPAGQGRPQATLADGTGRRRPGRRLVIAAGAAALAGVLGVPLLLRGDDRTRWTRAVPGDRVDHLIATADTLFVAVAGGPVYALDAATGRPQWAHDGQVRDLVGSGMALYAACADRVEAIDAATGRRRWSLPGETEQIAARGDVVVATTPDAIVDAHGVHVRGIDATGGRQRWSRTLSRPTEELITGTSPTLSMSESVVVVTLGRTVYGLAAATGRVRWRTPLGGADLGAGIVVGDTVLIGATGVGRPFYALDAVTGRPRWTAPVTEFAPGALTADVGAVYLSGSADLDGAVPTTTLTTPGDLPAASCTPPRRTAGGCWPWTPPQAGPDGPRTPPG